MRFVKDSPGRYVRVDGGVPVVWEVRDSGGEAGGRYRIRVNGGPGAELRGYGDREEAERVLAALVAGVADVVHELEPREVGHLEAVPDTTRE